MANTITLTTCMGVARSRAAVRLQLACVAVCLHCVSIKSSPFYFYGNFPNCKASQITFGKNIAEKIWNKLTWQF